MPVATIVLLSYNQGAYLRGSVACALSQSCSDIEVLVLENGSTDDSLAVLSEFSDPRLRIIDHPEHAWPGVRMNEGVRLARGRFISFLYSDDRYLPHKIEREVEQLERLGDGYGVSYCKAMRENVATGVRVVTRNIGASGNVFETMMKQGLKNGNLDMIGPLIRRDLLLDHPFHEDVFFESEAIFHRLALYTKFAFVPEPLVVALDHESNGGKRLARHREMSRECLRRLRHEPGLGARQRRLVGAYEAELQRSYGWQGARLAAPRAWTVDCYRAAFRTSPAATAVHPKVWAGLLLTAAPQRLQATTNRLGHLLKRNRLQPLWLGDYPTLKDEARSRT